MKNAFSLFVLLLLTGLGTGVVFAQVNEEETGETPRNTPPVAVDDYASTAQGAPVTINVLANDSDPDGDPLTVTAHEDVAHGTLRLGNDQQLTFSPDDGFLGTVQFSYNISDGNEGGTAGALVTIDVLPPNQAPTAVDDAATTPPRTSVHIDVLANDSDPDGDPLSFDVATNPALGVLSFDKPNLITYTPYDDVSSTTDSFTYVVSDGRGGTATATVTVTIGHEVNNPPLATSDAVTTTVNTSVWIDVLANDSDPDGDALSLLSVTTPTLGTAIVSGSKVLYTAGPTAGTDRITYRVADVHGAEAKATITVTITPPEGENQSPFAKNDAASTTPGTPVVIDVLANDSDPDGDPLSISFIHTPPASGTAVINNDHTITYTPAPGVTGTTDTFVYNVTDGHGGNAKGIVTVTIGDGNANRPPIAENDAASTTPGTPVVIDVLANDYDPDGDPLSFTGVETPSLGTVTVNNDYTLTYTPGLNVGGGTDSFSYYIADGQGAKATATVTVFIKQPPANTPPKAEDDAYALEEDTIIRFNPLKNDFDQEKDPLAVANLSAPVHGTVRLLGDEVEYTPPANFNGVDTFTYQAFDGNLFSKAATIQITVLPVNDPPVAYNGALSVDENGSAQGQLVADDPDGDQLSFSIGAQPLHGAISGFEPSTGVFTYTPTPGYFGPDSFRFTASDGAANSNEATVKITVIPPANHLPVANDAEYTIDEDTVLDVPTPGLLGLVTDADVQDVLQVFAVANPSHGALVLAASGGFTYTPEAGFSGQDTFTYRANDGTDNSNVATVTITVVPLPNNVPVANDDAFTTNEDTPLTIGFADLLANDEDADEQDVVTVSRVEQFDAGSGSYLTVHLPVEGTGFVYTPPAGFVGTDASYRYRITDGADESNWATITIEVLLVNEPPVAAAGDDQSFDCVAPDGVEVTLDGSASSDADGDDLTFAWTNAAGDVLGAEAVLTTTVPAGVHTLTLTVTDPEGDSDSDEVVVTVVADDTPPALTLAAEPLQLWPPNHKYHTVTLAGLGVNAVDACDGGISPGSAVIAGVTSDEPENAKGDGNTSDDIVIDDCSTVRVRAERQGGGNGRVYTLTIQAADAAGNVGEVLYEVHVPKTPKKGAVADAPVLSVPGCDPLAGPAARMTASDGADQQVLGAAADLPEAFALDAAYPNPFNPRATVPFAVPETGRVTLAVYDVLGREVARLVDGEMAAGRHTAVFEAGRLSSGLYLVRMTAPGFTATRPLTLMK